MSTLVCIRCKKPKPNDEFKSCERCRVYMRKIHKKARANGYTDTEEWRAYWRAGNNRRRLKERIAVIEMYGGKCVCCGDDEFRFLTVHHPNHDGAQHREEIGAPRGSNLFYRMLLRNPRRNDLVLLCANCHMGEDLFGGCPHRLRREGLNVSAIPELPKLPHPTLKNKVLESP